MSSPGPLPEPVEQILFWLGIIGELLIVGAEVYVAWTRGWIKLPF